MSKIKIGVLVYVKKDNKYLMLYRNKKEKDFNKGFWIAPGGKREDNESITDCAKREVYEETGLRVEKLKFLGFLHFPENIYTPFGEEWVDFVFLCEDFSGKVKDECNEGELKWIDEKDMLSLNMWEGDYIFTEYILKDEKFSIQLTYENKKLVSKKIETIF